MNWKFDFARVFQYELNLGAVGGGRVDGEGEELLLAEATLLVRVLDANDMAPVFEKPVYRAQLTEEDSEGLPKRIVTVSESWRLGKLASNGRNIVLNVYGAPSNFNIRKNNTDIDR